MIMLNIFYYVLVIYKNNIILRLLEAHINALNTVNNELQYVVSTY